jgi:hypothetical protein
MKPKKINKTELQCPLPANMYERAKKELEEANQQNVSKILENENNSTEAFVTRRINGLMYVDMWGGFGYGNQKKIV